MFYGLKQGGAALLALMLAAGGAQAATLSFTGTGTATVLPLNYDLSESTLPITGSPITVFEAFSNGGLVNGGLSVSGNARVTYTYIRKEAGYTNRIKELVTNGLIIDTAARGTSITTTQGAGAVDFAFTTSGNGGKRIVNGGLSDQKELGIAFSDIFGGGKSVYAFFDDGGANDDADYDDMLVRIDIAAVPVPAAGLLLLSGLGGLTALRRRRKA